MNANAPWIAQAQLAPSLPKQCFGNQGGSFAAALQGAGDLYNSAVQR
jgi:hypothetical protein